MPDLTHRSERWAVAILKGPLVPPCKPELREQAKLLALLKAVFLGGRWASC